LGWSRWILGKGRDQLLPFCDPITGSLKINFERANDVVRD